MHYRIPVHPIRRIRHSRMPRCVFLLLLLIFFISFFFPSLLVAEGQVTLLKVNGSISPAISDYLQKGIKSAKELKADVVILQLNTPGGLDHSMRQIIQAILASPVPVITYVAPDGARAASAGTYIIYASHIAAMSPATNLGAASPVRIGGTGAIPSAKKEDKDNNQVESKELTTMEKKIINDASAYIKALAERHGRNDQWAVKAVREAVSLSAEEALELGVIDIVATDITDLLAQANDRQVQMESGPYTISTKGLSVVPIEQSWRTRLLAVISDPNIAYILMLLGIYGLIYELANPGFILPGVVGGISLLLAFYAFQVLPVNYSGVALIILGGILLLSEMYVPSFGSLGVGGIIALAIGSIILMKDEELRVALPIVIGTILVCSAFLIWLTGRLFLIRRRKNEIGMEAMVGMTAEAADNFDHEGWIWVLGESWRARSTASVRKGEMVRITGYEGLFLTIEKYQEVA